MLSAPLSQSLKAQANQLFVKQLVRANEKGTPKLYIIVFYMGIHSSQMTRNIKSYGEDLVATAYSVSALKVLTQCPLNNVTVI